MQHVGDHSKIYSAEGDVLWEFVCWKRVRNEIGKQREKRQQRENCVGSCSNSEASGVRNRQ